MRTADSDGDCGVRMRNLHAEKYEMALRMLENGRISKSERVPCIKREPTASVSAVPQSTSLPVDMVSTRRFMCVR